jgi:hypothetical protein
MHVQLPGSIGAADVFDGVLGVMGEIAAKKISSEEETFSDLSLMIYHNNWLGGYSQILPFAKVRSTHGPFTLLCHAIMNWSMPVTAVRTSKEQRSSIHSTSV